MKYSCCKNVNGVCSIHDIKSIDSLLYAIKLTYSELTESKIKYLYYGYGCPIDIDYSFTRLRLLEESLQRIKKSFVSDGNSCLNDEIIQKLKEQTIKLTSRDLGCEGGRLDLVIDNTKLNSYLLTGPKCVSYDTWNEFSSFICGKLGFNVSFVEDEESKCNLVFAISRNIIPCDILYTLKIRKELCDINFKIARTKDECKIDYKLLLEKHPTCNLSFSMYLSLIGSNISYNMMDVIYRNNLSLTQSAGTTFICTPLGNYDIEDITPTDLQELLDNGFVVSLKEFDLKQDFI